MYARTWSKLAAAAALVMALPAVAAAQGYGPGGGPGGGPPGPPPAGPTQDPQGFWPRGGIYGGFGLGPGSTTFDSDLTNETVHEGLSLQGNIGWKFNPRIGISFDAWTVLVPDEFVIDDGVFAEDATMSNTFWTIGAQFWVLPALWIKGGLGGGQQGFHSASFDVDGDEGPAFMLGAGYEILHSPELSIDLALRVGVANYDERIDGTATNAALDISINFHQLMFWSGY